MGLLRLSFGVDATVACYVFFSISYFSEYSLIRISAGFALLTCFIFLTSAAPKTRKLRRASVNET